jgi:hypothetical protein
MTAPANTWSGDMATIVYNGQSIVIDVGYSFARVSSPRQEQDGEGIDRQLKISNEWSARTGVPIDADDAMTALGLSGRGKHLANGTALAKFRELAVAGQLKPNPALIVESFSRLSRLAIDEGLTLFFDIVCKGRCPLITLIDGHVYTRESLRANPGEIHLISAHIGAARAESDSKAFYATKGWDARRGSDKMTTPAWITGTMCNDKAPIFRRMCDLVMIGGVDTIARTFNSEGIPIPHDRKRRRDTYLWEGSTILAVLRGRQLIGQQQIGHRVDGKRVVGGWVDAFEPLLTKPQWDAIQHRLDSRKCGTFTGRNVSRMVNLFGALARCECGSRMKVQGRGKKVPYQYLKCSAAIAGSCAIKKLYRLDWMEQRILPRVADEVLDDTPQVDQTASLTAQITQAKKEAGLIEAAYLQAMSRTGPLAIKTQGKLEADHTAAVDRIAKLERDFGVLMTTKPASEQQRAIRTVLTAALDGDVVARARIAEALPGLVRTVVCLADGQVRVEGIRLLAWTIRLQEQIKPKR